jgi:large subunit ribosomal protein L28
MKSYMQIILQFVTKALVLATKNEYFSLFLYPILVVNRLCIKNNLNSPCFINNISYFCRPKIKDMARVCELTGKRPIVGNKVSHSNIKTKRRFLPNLQTKRYFLAEEDKWIVMKLSSEAIRTINKNGLYATVKEMRAAGSKI